MVRHPIACRLRAPKPDATAHTEDHILPLCCLQPIFVAIITGYTISACSIY